MSIERKPHLTALTGLRFFAAIYIVLFHHANQALSNLSLQISRLIEYGYISVSLFFILSGFILAYIYLGVGYGRPIDIKRFWIARFARVYPLYLLALIVSLPSFIAKIPDNSLLEWAKAALTGVSAIALLQAWTPWTATVWNTPAWAVSVEVFCYLLFPFLALRIAKLDDRKIVLLAVLLWLAALVAPILHLLFTQNIGITASQTLWLILVVYCPIFHLPQFLIGVCVGILFLRETSKAGDRSSFKSRHSLFVGISFLLVLFWLSNTSTVPYELLNNGLLAPVFAAVIYVLAHGEGIISSCLSWSGFLILGEASYAIYLFQNPMLSGMKIIAEKASKLGTVSSSFFGSFPFLICYLLILIGFSIFAFYYLETPLRKALVVRLNKIFLAS